MNQSLDREFENRNAIVTGAASGIGAAVAELLAERGASVLIADFDLAKAEKVAAAIVAAGGKARAHKV
ncbi:MAG TPA: SDR family NAD(P)-dependent oxidoreductase, partial [Burkholderiaceae bacterium]|nr:SDR family NAD(P)-dependent oxidoreductase [Burkholderiaceae bacterium]